MILSVHCSAKRNESVRIKDIYLSGQAKKSNLFAPMRFTWTCHIPRTVEYAPATRHFLPRDAMHSADYAVAKCPSVHLSHAVILSKQLNISNFFTVGSH